MIQLVAKRRRKLQKIFHLEEVSFDADVSRLRVQVVHKHKVRGVFHCQRDAAALRRQDVTNFAAKSDTHGPKSKQPSLAPSAQRTNSHWLREARHFHDSAAA